MIGVYRWGYGGGFEEVAFWGWVEAGFKKNGSAGSIVEKRRPYLMHDVERRRKAVTSGAVNHMAVTAAHSPKASKVIRGGQRTSVLGGKGNVYKAENRRQERKTVAEACGHSAAADAGTNAAIVKSAAKTKIIKKQTDPEKI